MPFPAKALLRSTLAAALICGAALPVSAQSTADLPYRLSTLEEQIRQLNGQVETLSHRVRQLEQQLGAARAGSAPSDGVPAGGSVPMDMSGDYGIGGGNQAGPGAPPAILGQVPATGPTLDLSGAFDGPSPVQQGPDGSVSIQEGGGRYGGTETGSQQAFLPPGGTPEDDYDTAYGYVLRGEFGPAQQAFGAFLQRHPDNELAGNAQYWLGEALFATGRYRDAADAFLAGYTEYPRSAKAPDSLYKLGMSLKELGQADAACATFSEISRTFPNAPQAVVERTRSEMERSGC